jgi:hypothetical protein
LILLLVLTACSGGKDSGDAAEALDPTLTNVQAQIFDGSCAFSSCHSGANGSGQLDLTAGNAYASLVNVESSAAAGEIRVIPGDSANSYVVKKCTLGATFTGDLMPQGTTEGLDADRLDLLKAWIDAGAADD